MTRGDTVEASGDTGLHLRFEGAMMRDSTKLKRDGWKSRFKTTADDVITPRDIDGLPVFQPGELITPDMLNRIVARLLALEDKVRTLEAR